MNPCLNYRKHAKQSHKVAQYLKIMNRTSNLIGLIEVSWRSEVIDASRPLAYSGDAPL
jgi:hypothetical protein